MRLLSLLAEDSCLESLFESAAVFEDSADVLVEVEAVGAVDFASVFPSFAAGVFASFASLAVVLAVAASLDFEAASSPAFLPAS